MILSHAVHCGHGMMALHPVVIHHVVLSVPLHRRRVTRRTHCMIIVVWLGTAGENHGRQCKCGAKGSFLCQRDIHDPNPVRCAVAIKHHSIVDELQQHKMLMSCIALKAMQFHRL
ncbi:hypothetical protein ACFOW2_03160 [Salinispirillum marinum]|uniref:Secreted protein n=1 Tax=Saccharospirillum mangrovi TaxID=2161747 RepID=A0ABV7ZYV5_9GAMM